MTVIERIDQDLKEAMKAKSEQRLSVLRMARTSLKNKQIEMQKDLDDQSAFAVLKTMIKQYQDAISDFQTAGRQDLVEKQQQEIDILSAYLPPAMPVEEVEKIVKEAVAGMQASDMGKAMGAAMKAVDGKADGNTVRAIVQRLLSE
ncbi:MAG: GatB/YqeY domain-containing protein [Candidatus Magasanikbacteria bacterium]|nr:GatB/YqeY domain-containing protein [Candidatus Magasanikbacteria bacterium]MCA9389140.1 GatB/YqeY domain-containing protein [Candidatus Magasanikbacteria bacterium]MCA9391201.1 GatB/YqeY domain-containing protein [Candidatus Magasanikbacteria bacterium]USN52139.1 MAG: GatB/YqeY domain-containing protein [Candidatus Nomurabacteria bacterium]HPF94975.1 GatB/YqeY domain-containing protein [bacterium]